MIEMENPNRGQQEKLIANHERKDIKATKINYCNWSEGRKGTKSKSDKQNEKNGSCRWKQSKYFLITGKKGKDKSMDVTRVKIYKERRVREIQIMKKADES